MFFALLQFLSTARMYKMFLEFKFCKVLRSHLFKIALILKCLKLNCYFFFDNFSYFELWFIITISTNKMKTFSLAFSHVLV